MESYPDRCRDFRGGLPEEHEPGPKQCPNRLKSRNHGNRFGRSLFDGCGRPRERDDVQPKHSRLRNSHACPLLGIPFSKAPCQSHTAWSWHVSIAIEPAGNYLFDATLYRKVSRYSGASSGMLNLLHGPSLAQRDSISRCLFFSDECCGILDPEILFPIEEFRSAMTTLSQESP